MDYSSAELELLGSGDREDFTSTSTDETFTENISEENTKDKTTIVEEKEERELVTAGPSLEYEVHEENALTQDGSRSESPSVCEGKESKSNGCGRTDEWSLINIQTMGRILILSLILLLSSSLYQSVREVWSRPTILRPRAARPFFSNTSSNYLTDYYSGDLRINRLINTVDLLIVMYYAPWNTHSKIMQHPFEVTARIFQNKRYVRFIAVNCWDLNGECRSNYKLSTFPVIVAYSKSVSVTYSGEIAVDQLFRWIRSISNPLKRVNSLEDLRTYQKVHQHVVLAYFPFTMMSTPSGYRAYAAAGMMLATGRNGDTSTLCTVVTSLSLARQLGIRFEGDIQLYRATESVLFWPKTRRDAQEIRSWIEKERNVPASIQWIQLNRNDELFSESFTRLLNETSLLVLITDVLPTYQGQDDLVIYSQLSNEYWSCADDYSPTIPSSVIEYDDRLDVYLSDKLACEKLPVLGYEAISCCRSLLSYVDWNMACASSAKYKWEHDNKEKEDESRRRSHWSEQVLPDISACSQHRDLSADNLVDHCCSVYDEITQPVISEQQRRREKLFAERNQQHALDLCMRSKLVDYVGSSLQHSARFDESYPSANNSLEGYGCTKNDSLRFAVLDARANSYFLNKWGIHVDKIPTVVSIDASRETFSVLDDVFSEKSVRSFVRDYHQHVVDEFVLVEGNTKSRFAEPILSVGDNKIVRDAVSLNRLNRSSFIDLLDAKDVSFDQLVFFSGGNWHAPSTAVLHVMHSLANYFSDSSSLIKFYVLDTSRNELPYNFNFETIPSLVLFMANRRDLSWKFPETLPLSVTNVLSFLLSRCSPILRWRTSLLSCDRQCASRNRSRLRRHLDVLLRDIHSIPSKLRGPSAKWRQMRISQLATLRSTLRFLHMNQFMSSRFPLSILDKMLHSQSFSAFFNSLRL